MEEITTEEIKKAIEALSKSKVPTEGRMFWNPETGEVEKI